MRRRRNAAEKGLHSHFSLKGITAALASLMHAAATIATDVVCWIRTHWNDAPRSELPRPPAAPAAIEVSSPPKCPLPEQARIEAVDGLVGLDEDGRFSVTDPLGGGRYAVILAPVAPSPLELRVNGIVVTGEVVVERKDRIRAKVVDRPAKSSFAIHINESASQARLMVEYHPGEKITLRPQPPVSRLALTWETESVVSQPISLGSVMAEMGRQGIVWGRIEESRIAEFLLTNVSGSLVVASSEMDGFDTRQGQGPLPGSTAVRDRPLVHAVDFVEAGTILATVGEVKRRVTGEPMAIGPWVGGQGTAVMADGRHLVALHSGRLERGIGPIRVYREHWIEGDVGPHDILVEGEGDVIVNGNVSQSTIVAQGEIIVSGAVTKSELHAGGRVACGQTALDSWFYSGSMAKTARHFRAELEALLQELFGLHDLFVQCEAVAHQTDRRLPNDLIKRLVEYKFPDAHRQVQRLCTLEEGMPGLITAPEDRESLWHLKDELSPENLAQLKSPREIMGLVQRRWAKDTPSSSVDRGDLPKPSSQLARVRNSVIFARGSVTLVDAIDSRLDISDTLMVRNSLRGGQSSIGRHLQADSLGSASGVETRIDLHPGATWLAGMRHVGVTIQNMAGETDYSTDDTAWGGAASMPRSK